MEEEEKKLKIYAVILLCRNIHETPLQILSSLANHPKYKNYHFYAMIDHNHQPLSTFQIEYPKITLLQIPDIEAYNHGFHHMTYSIRKTPVSWDKAIYYFSEKCAPYDYYWFIEDDVLIPHIETICNIDLKYQADDYHLLSQSNTISFSYDLPTWQWHAAKGYIGLPLFSSLMCASRISKRLLEVVRDYARQKNTLFFLEILFPTLCCQNTLKNKVIPELKTIEYRRLWTFQEIVQEPNYLYHPIKQYDVQKYLFETINQIKL